jgi:hypothetical protein
MQEELEYLVTEAEFRIVLAVCKRDTDHLRVLLYQILA